MNFAERLALHPPDKVGIWSLWRDDPNAWGGHTRGGDDLGLVYGSWMQVCVHVKKLDGAEYIDAKPWAPPEIVVLAGEENTGLPCDACGRKQPKVSMGWSGDGEHQLLRLNVSIPKAKVLQEVKGLCSLLLSIARGGA